MSLTEQQKRILREDGKFDDEDIEMFDAYRINYDNIKNLQIVIQTYWNGPVNMTAINRKVVNIVEKFYEDFLHEGPDINSRIVSEISRRERERDGSIDSDSDIDYGGKRRSRKTRRKVRKFRKTRRRSNRKSRKSKRRV